MPKASVVAVVPVPAVMTTAIPVAILVVEIIAAIGGARCGVVARLIIVITWRGIIIALRFGRDRHTGR
jgi:hypothetical protein